MIENGKSSFAGERFWKPSSSKADFLPTTQNKMKNIDSLKRLYHGFEISAALGNNAFSYDNRKNKKIYVPPLISGSPQQLQKGRQVVFSEIEEGIEKNRCGLLNFIHYGYENKTIFIFDNHNHAFFFWLAGYLAQEISPGGKLVHIDQHSDMRQPQTYFPFTLEQVFSLQDVFDYTNKTLNVGNFIKPALILGLFAEVEIIDSSVSFENLIPDDFVLDIDLDIFSEEMDYIDFDLKVKKIKDYICKAKFITMASSPYFMDQDKAIRIAGELFS